MEIDKFIIVDENDEISSDKSKSPITNNEKIDILTKLIEEVDKKVESDSSIKKLIK